MTRVILLAALTLIQITVNVNSQNSVQFFEQTDFKGLIWQGATKAESACTVLPEAGRNRTTSLITNTCLMVYPSTSCSSSPNFAILPGRYSDLSEVQHRSQNATKLIQSFRACKEDEGDKAVHVELVDLVSDYPYRTMDLVEYFNVTECINLPSYTVSRVDTVANHGNCVTLFDGADCTGGSVTLQGGNSLESASLENAGFGGKARSLAPCNLAK